MVFTVSCSADLDPIYFCELLKACPVDDYGDAEILSLKVNPNTVHKGRDTSLRVGRDT